MRTLSIDLETYSSVDIKSSGLYKYVQSPDFEILLFAYAYDDDPVQIVDMACGEQITQSVIADLSRADVHKHAYNAAFEYYCLSKFYATSLDQWHCTMIHALYCGLPASLEAAGKALRLPQDKRKMSAGKALIRYFCVPCKPSKVNGGRTRNLPKHDLDKWNLFKKYCLQDVDTERTIKRILNRYPFPESEHLLWCLDQRINIGGARVDMELVNGAIDVHNTVHAELTQKAQDVTGLDNPNSVAQLKEWVMRNSDLQIDSLDKKTIAEILSEQSGTDLVHEMLQIRQELAKTSVKKYQAMSKAACADGRIRGLIQFYGANRTGRFAGRLVQVQNLPRNYLDSLDTARSLVKSRNVSALKLLYGNVPDTLSQLIRTAFIPADGHQYVVADFSAIEARVIAWLAGEEWRMQVFRTHGKIYEASASAMFGVDISLIKKGNPEYALRAKGKVAELALGYQGAAGALIQMGALNMGLTEDELPDIVSRWRASNRCIVNLWYTMEQAAVECVKTGRGSAVRRGVVFQRDERNMIVTLPSGRQLFYPEPALIPDERGYGRLWFSGTDQKTGKWGRIQTYGGKLTENIVQAIARDCLACAMQRLDAAGYHINFHIHDEVVLECPEDSDQTLENAVRIMTVPPAWAPDLPLNADGFTGDYYKKE